MQCPKTSGYCASEEGVLSRQSVTDNWGLPRRTGAAGEQAGGREEDGRGQRRGEISSDEGPAVSWGKGKKPRHSRQEYF